jgi:23S rRNA (cytidine1920-2'-O)/16S rRNA (cytidine1409-2'-O)-methyltransferase
LLRGNKRRHRITLRGVTPPRRRLDSELVRRGLADSRTRAAALIGQGRVLVDGVVTRRASLAITGQDLSVAEHPDGPELASRGGHKLAGALDHWPQVPVVGRRVLDAGASTGGFTDVLLRRGAGAVIAVDVGTDQLVPRLRDDPRVRVVDHTNVRTLTAQDIGGRADLTVCDLSFISLRLVLDALIRCTEPAGNLLAMVKPQFEVGREALGRGGVVRDRHQRAAAVNGVATYGNDAGWGARGVVRSPLPGPAGNVEYFLWLRRGRATVEPATIQAIVTADGSPSLDRLGS